MHSEEDFHRNLPDKERKLTIAELRKYEGFENISDSAAGQITEELYQLSLLCFSIYKSFIQKR